MEYVQDSLGEHSARSSAESDMDSLLRSHLSDFAGNAGGQWNHHLLTLIKRHNIMRILHFDHLYRMVVDVPGAICEFGVQFGSSLALLTNLRSIYEPYNASRLIFGFDTFEGIAGSSDVKDSKPLDGTHLVPLGYEATLKEILAAHEGLGSLGHMRRVHLYKGDAREQVSKWLEDYPGMPVAMVHLDMDVYGPTREVIESLTPRLVHGSLLVFDELTAPFFPGESQAVMDTLGFGGLKLRRSPMQPYSAWAIYGD